MILPLEQQVASKELSQQLCELGFPQDTMFVWVQKRPERADDDPVWHIKRDGDWPAGMKIYDSCAAPTCSELGKFLPMEIHIDKKNYFFETVCNNKKLDNWIIFYSNTEKKTDVLAMQMENGETNARAKMLIYLLQNKFLTFGVYGKRKM